MKASRSTLSLFGFRLDFRLMFVSDGFPPLHLSCSSVVMVLDTGAKLHWIGRVLI